ncbi:hypothetical protein [Nocardia aurantia]|uniref:Uncharacterized protein n=1 Tax=Nocardia aurantia TaxID=2585199 RepID=A0A7K0E020_9NOCA|nr:hypothetical protein [Nocardia aurantia]MQY30872.1 hypothetical protein [Nocardia aurantia]
MQIGDRVRIGTGAQVFVVTAVIDDEHVVIGVPGDQRARYPIFVRTEQLTPA